MRAVERGDEHAWAILNGERMPVAEARVPVVDEGFLRGDGVFEVLRLYRGRPFRGRDHLDRLARSAEIVRLPYDREALEREVRQLASLAGRRDCAMRIVVSRGGTRLAMLEALRPLEPVGRLVLVVDQPRPVLQGAKTLSYAANMLAAAAAREAGGTDALLVSGDGRVLESQTAAFFWADQEGQLVTPPVSEGILDSITRRVVLSAMPVVERSCAVSEVLRSREAFLASTLREVQPVAAIADVALSPVPGPLTERAVERFREVVRRETGLADGV